MSLTKQQHSLGPTDIAPSSYGCSELGSTLLVAQVPPPPIHGNGRCEPTPSRAKRAQAVASVSLIHSRRGGPGAGFPREAPRGAPDRCLTTGIPVGRDCADSRQGMAARDSRHQDHHHSTTEGAVAAIKNSPGSCPQPRPPGTTTAPPRATTPRGGRASRNGIPLLRGKSHNKL